MIPMSIEKNLAAISDDIRMAAHDFAREPGDVTLIAVSKKQPDSRIDEALAAGQRVFGENRVQEAQIRWAERRKIYPDLFLHLIGPLQTNKAADAVALFDVIETLDRPKLVGVLAKEMEKQDRWLPCFIQVNTGEEDQKAGVLPADLPELLFMARDAGLSVEGLMCIPPVDDASGVHFSFLKTLADKHGLAKLSMGMSADYKQAIAAGAHYVRVGSAVFGERLPA